MAALQFEGHDFEMDGETLRVDGGTHWYRCSECGQACKTGGVNGSGSSLCHGAVVANLRYGYMLPPHVVLPPSMQPR